jgi:hypothetical protein
MKNKFGIRAMKNNHNNLFQKKNKNKKLKWNSRLYHFYLLRLRFIILQMDPQVQLKKNNKKIQEIYDVFQRIDHNDVIFFCLFIDDEPLTFEKGLLKAKRKKEIKEEITTINKNNI